MTLPTIHDPADLACRCHYCCQAQHTSRALAGAEAALEAECRAAAARAERELQLRLPMAPLPHSADQPRTLARLAARAFVNAARNAPPVSKAGGALPQSK